MNEGVEQKPHLLSIPIVSDLSLYVAQSNEFYTNTVLKLLSKPFITNVVSAAISILLVFQRSCREGATMYLGFHSLFIIINSNFTLYYRHAN